MILLHERMLQLDRGKLNKDQADILKDVVEQVLNITIAAEDDTLMENGLLALNTLISCFASKSSAEYIKILPTLVSKKILQNSNSHIVASGVICIASLWYALFLFFFKFLSSFS